MKTWKIGKLRPLTILVGFHAYEWPWKIRRQHSTSFPEDWSGHPSQVVEFAYNHCLMANNNDNPWVLIINRLETIYVINNCISAFGMGDVEIPGIVRPEFRLNPKKVIAYQCDSETEEPVCISDPETGWIDEEPLGRYGERLQTELNRISIALEDRRIKDTSKRVLRVKDTSKKAQKLDHDKIAAGLGAKRTKR